MSRRVPRCVIFAYIYAPIAPNKADLDAWDGWQVSEHFAVRRYPEGYHFTHLPSGHGMAGLWSSTLDEAVRIAVRLERVKGWRTLRPSKRTLSRAAKSVRQWLPLRSIA